MQTDAMALDEVKTATYAFGKQHRFSRKTSTLWLYQEETIGVVNLHRSNYGPSYYVNVGLWLRSLGEEAQPKEHACHVRTRIENLVERPDSDCSAFDLDLDFDTAARAIAISNALTEVLEVLHACSRTAGLLQAPGDRFLTRGGAWVRADARELLASIQLAD